MENQLKTLISLYEEEKTILEKLIKECLADEEYLMAHYHSSALYQINGRLQTLNNIDDNFYDDKQYKISRINILEQQIENTDSGYMKEYYFKELLKTKEELEKLKQIPIKVQQQDTHLILDKALVDLLDKKIKNLKLFLKKSDNFFLSFTCSSKTLKVIIPYVKQHLKKWRLHDENLETLRNIGFDMPANGTRLVLIISGDKQTILNQLKTILSKIIFEIFYYKEFDNECYLQFTDKNFLGK